MSDLSPLEAIGLLCIVFAVLACTALLVPGWLISRRHRQLVRDAQEGRR